MTDQAEPGRPPAHDLAAFDVSKRSPEQIAQAFARWKAQRKRPRQGPEPARAGQPPYPRPMPAIARGAAQDALPVSEDVTDQDSARAPAEKLRPIQYSTPFAALLAAGSEPTVAHRIWYPDVRLPRLRRPQPARRRPKATWILTGAACVIAVAAMASGALWEQSQWRGPAEAKPSAAQVHPLDIPFVAAATAVRAAEWNLQQTIDLALMTAAPIAEPVHPPVPAVQTASKAAVAPKSAPAAQPLSEPKLEIAGAGALQFVAKPFVPSAPPAVAGSLAAAASLGVDPRPDDLVQRGHDKRNNTFGANNRVAAPGSKPAGVAGSGGSADPRSASSRSGGAATGGAATGGASDPASGGTGDDSTGDGSGAGGDAGGGDTGSGDAGDGDTGGGDSGSGDGSGEGGSAGSGGVGNGGGGSEDKNKGKSD